MHHRYLAVFWAIFLGCATNCLPAALPALLARVVAAYSCGERDLIAADGRYRSPVSDERLPDLVRHFCEPQSLSDCCGAFNLDTPRPEPCIASLTIDFYGLTIPPHLYPELPMP